MMKKNKVNIAGMIDELLSPEEYTIEKSNDEGIIVRVSPTNIGHNRGKSATIDQINEAIIDGLNRGLERKKYRKRDELPDPNRPANDPVNLRRKPVSLRCEPELTEAMNRAASIDCINRNDWINAAIVEKLRREHPELIANPNGEAEPDLK